MMNRDDPIRRGVLNLIWRDTAERNPGKFEVLDLEAEVCPNGTWQEMLDGVPLRSDGVHYTGEGPPSLAMAASSTYHSRSGAGRCPTG